jgi:hypothetical protein
MQVRIESVGWLGNTTIAEASIDLPCLAQDGTPLGCITEEVILKGKQGCSVTLGLELHRSPRKDCSAAEFLARFKQDQYDFYNYAFASEYVLFPYTVPVLPDAERDAEKTLAKVTKPRLLGTEQSFAPAEKLVKDYTEADEFQILSPFGSV